MIKGDVAYVTYFMFINLTILHLLKEKQQKNIC